MTALTAPFRWCLDRMKAIPDGLTLTLARLVMAAVFWQLGRAGSDGVWVSQDTMFTYEFDYQLPLVNPYVAAFVVTLAEQVLAILLALGLGTRFAAAGLLLLTVLIQIYIAPSVPLLHALWAALLLILMAKGGGPLSLDRMLARQSGNGP